MPEDTFSHSAPMCQRLTKTLISLCGFASLSEYALFFDRMTHWFCTCIFVAADMRDSHTNKFLILCCGYSLEVPRRGASNKYLYNVCFL